MIKQLRLFESTSFDPYKNLAAEKHLLDTAPPDSMTLYLWQNENTVVIGRNQNPWSECRCSLLEQEGGRVARRLSGGGAVYHDTGNLNFTFLCKKEDYDLEKQLHVIRAACTLAGIETELSGRNDILADGRKFSGNAFYNTSDRSYHHGTLLINTDLEKMKRYLTPPASKLAAKGVRSVRSRTADLREFSPSLTVGDMKRYMAAAFEKVYGMQAELCEMPNGPSVARLAEKYAGREYIYGSSLPFTLSAEERFSWGHICLQLKVEKGVILTAKVFTDSMDWSLSELSEKALTGCLFELSAVQTSLSAVLTAETARDISALLGRTV